MAKRHAEIAGGGFAGLVAAIALAERGFSVRVHERTPLLRAEGFALTIHGNGIHVLRALAVFERAVRGAMRVSGLETRNKKGEVTLSLVPAAPVYRISREHLITTLADEATRRGVEVCADSPAIGARPDGTLLLADGRELRADLVIAADGVHSRVRDSLALRVRRTPLPAGGAFRVMIPRSDEERRDEAGGEAMNYELWSGTRRIIANPASRDELYLALSCQTHDRIGQALPIDVDSWSRAFPAQADWIQRIRRDAAWDRVQWSRFEVVRLSRWSEGRVAVVGDAAHAMPPDLGQGGGTAIVNALGLADAIENESDLPVALARWERLERPLTEHTQRVARIYSHSTLWPERLRTWVFKRVGASPALRRRVQRTANHVPRGALGADA